MANLHCTPRNGVLRNIISDSFSKRSSVSPTSNHDILKKSDIDKSIVLYSEDGLPVDTSKTVVKAFRS